MTHCSCYNIDLLNLQIKSSLVLRVVRRNNENLTLKAHTGTPQYSVRPLPEQPSTPNELLSSIKRRNRYFSFSLIISSSGAIWPEFCKQESNKNFLLHMVLFRKRVHITVKHNISILLVHLFVIVLYKLKNKLSSLCCVFCSYFTYVKQTIIKRDIM